MIGAIIGDIVGSRFEWSNIKTKDFELFTPECRFTDDSVMTIAIAEAIINTKSDFSLNLGESVVKAMQKFGQLYPRAGYGGMFRQWLVSISPQPYYSFGNGSAMRISSVIWLANSIEQVKLMSKAVTEVTHNHPEGLKGAEAIAVAGFMARTGHSKDEIRKEINDNYYTLDFTIDRIRPNYDFNVTCQGSVPQAIESFLESDSFEDAIRNAISLGGDSDTIGAMSGAIAEAFYGVPKELEQKAITYLKQPLLDVLKKFKEVL